MELAGLTNTSWMDRKSNKIILSEMNEGRLLIEVIAKRKAKIIGVAF